MIEDQVCATCDPLSLIQVLCPVMHSNSLAPDKPASFTASLGLQSTEQA